MVYFAGGRVDNGTVRDRLGTVVLENGSAKAYFPFDEVRSGTGEMEFATYPRDSVTNLDYAQERWYSSQIGRFVRSDPDSGSAQAQVPQSSSTLLDESTAQTEEAKTAMSEANQQKVMDSCFK